MLNARAMVRQDDNNSGEMHTIFSIRTKSNVSKIRVWLFALVIVVFHSTSIQAAPGGCEFNDMTVEPWQRNCVPTCYFTHTFRPGCDYLNYVWDLCIQLCGNTNEQSCETTSEHPVDISDRTKYRTEVDYRQESAFPLHITRYYSSARISPEGNFGSHWRSEDVATVEARQITPEGEASYDIYTVIRPDGRRIQFTWVGGGATAPLKSNTKEVLTLFNYSEGEQVWELKLPNGAIELYEFSATVFIAESFYRSKILWIQNPQALRHYYSYDAQDRVQRIEDAYGTGLNYTYTTDGLDLITQIVVDGGQTFRYEYDTNQNLVYAIFPDDNSDPDDNPRKQYHYESSYATYLLTGITDENGDRFATFDYDNNGRAILSELNGGADRLEFIEDDLNTVRTINANGKETIYHFETVGPDDAPVRRLVSVEGVPSENCVGGTKARTYDSNSHLASSTDWNGMLTTYSRNTLGQEIFRTEAVGTPAERSISTSWHTAYYKPTQIAEPNKTTTMTYDGLARMLSRTETDTRTATIPYSTNGNSRAWSYSYGANELLAEIDGPRTDVTDTTTFEYDALGNVTKVTNALGHETLVLGRDAQGLPTLTEDANGVQTALSYTPRGWLASRTLDGSATTQFIYDAVGQVTQITLPSGSQLNYSYDAAHRLTQISNQLGERIEYQLDALGGRTAETIYSATDNIVRTQSRVFDDLGRLIQDLGANGQVMSYTLDAEGNRTAISDGVHPTTTQAFDGLNRLILTVDPAGSSTAYNYDGQDNLISVTDPRTLTTSYSYDGLGNVIQVESPDTGTSVNEYDAAGNLVRQTDARGVVSEYSYDALNRMLTKTYPASPDLDVTYSYDDTAGGNYGIGRLTQMQDNSGSTSYEYDARGNMVREVRLLEGHNYITQYDYDDADNLIEVIYASGRIVEYSRDALGRVTSVRTKDSVLASWQTVAENITYLPFGPVSSLTYGNGLETSFVYDHDFRLTNLNTGQGVLTLQQLVYNYDNLNNITAIGNNLDPSQSQSFSYDALNRLTAAAGSYGALLYEYDAVGNRTSRVNGSIALSETYNYAGDSNRLLSVDRTLDGVADNRALSYTAAGNLASDANGSRSLNLDYDDSNRLRTVSEGGSTIGDYLYNALGQRVRKTAAGQTLHFIYNQNGQLLAESFADGTPVRDYIYLDGLRLAMVSSTGPAPDQADVGVSLAVTHSGVDVSYDIEVTNAGPDNAANVLLNHTTGGELSMQSFSASSGSCTLVTPQQLDCDLGTLVNAAAVTISVVALLSSADADVTDILQVDVSSDTLDAVNSNNSDSWQEGTGNGGCGSCSASCAATGTAQVDYLDTLRTFRDGYMMPYGVGRWLTGAYYDASPMVVAWFEAYPWLKVPARLLLWLAIGIAWLIQASWKVQVAVGAVAAGLTIAFKLGMAGWLWSFNLIRGLLVIAGLALASALFAGSAQAGDLLFFHNDHLGTAQIVTDENQTVVWQAEQQPFGEVTTTVSAQENPTRFPGQYYDGESGFHYNMMRDYDPTLGRYVQSDPIGLQGGLNTYAYAVGNPISYADPTGEFIFLLNPYTIAALTGFPILMMGYADYLTAVNAYPVLGVDPVFYWVALALLTYNISFEGDEACEKKNCQRAVLREELGSDGKATGRWICAYRCRGYGGLIIRFNPSPASCPSEVDWVPGEPT